MPEKNRDVAHHYTGTVEGITEICRQEALIKTSALQSAIFNSANFSSIATDAKGVIQIFNVGAERMLGYTAAEVMNKITPADISDPQELIDRARALSIELDTPITPGFEALKILREDPLTAHIPVIAISASAMQLNLDRGLKAGFFRYLTKPIKVNEFMEAMDIALEFADQQIVLITKDEGQ